MNSIWSSTGFGQSRLGRAVTAQSWTWLEHRLWAGLLLAHPHGAQPRAWGREEAAEHFPWMHLSRMNLLPSVIAWI